MHVIDPDDRGAFNQRLRKLVGRDAVTAFVAVDDTEGPVPPEQFEDIGWMAAFAARSGIERVALVGEGVTPIAIEGTVDRPALDVDSFEDRTAALERARDDEQYQGRVHNFRWHCCRTADSSSQREATLVPEPIRYVLHADCKRDMLFWGMRTEVNLPERFPARTARPRQGL